VYAAVHQFGLGAKVFGKKAFTMTARPFMGKSKQLEEKIYAEINRDLDRILFNR
jgi:phage gpG-like protein